MLRGTYAKHIKSKGFVHEIHEKHENRSKDLKAKNKQKIVFLNFFRVFRGFRGQMFLKLFKPPTAASASSPPAILRGRRKPVFLNRTTPAESPAHPANRPSNPTYGA
jgi:hypothetical protein